MRSAKPSTPWTAPPTVTSAGSLVVAWLGVNASCSRRPRIPMAMLTAGLGVLWGRSVIETKGLGWAVCAHASIDLVFFLVQLVPAG